MFLALLPCCHLAKNSNCKSYSYPFTINITFALITINLIMPTSFMVYVYVQSSNPASPSTATFLFPYIKMMMGDSMYPNSLYIYIIGQYGVWLLALLAKRRKKKKSSSNCMFALRTNLLHAQAFTWLNCKCLTVRPSVDLSSIFLSTYSWTLRLP